MDMGSGEGLKCAWGCRLRECGECKRERDMFLCCVVCFLISGNWERGVWSECAVGWGGDGGG